jgi:hypothetical protein
MTLTLNIIRSHSPCAKGWAKLLKHLNKTTADDEPLSLLAVLDSNGIQDAIWCLRTEPTPERIQRFVLAVARRVEHLHPTAKACNDITERYLNGTATKAELDAANAAARIVADTAGNAAVRIAARTAAYTAYAAYGAYAVAYATYATTDAAYATTDAAYATGYITRSAFREAAYAAERKAQVQIFKEIFA